MKNEFFDTTIRDKTDKKNKNRRERELNDIRVVVSEPEGRRLFWRILKHAGIYNINDLGNSTAFRIEGRRAEGLYWLSELMTADRKVFARIQEENYSEAVSEQKQLEKEQSNG
ncbi:MAG: hypothetical protein EOM59_10780 [Clostridia bacterium]|nr:hypothetical protein [Clostridia bacterium]